MFKSNKPRVLLDNLCACGKGLEGHSTVIREGRYGAQIGIPWECIHAVPHRAPKRFRQKSPCTRRPTIPLYGNALRMWYWCHYRTYGDTPRAFDERHRVSPTGTPIHPTMPYARRRVAVMTPDEIEEELLRRITAN